MNLTLMRLLGLMFIIASLIVAILNLKRVAGLGMTWLPPVLFIFGIVLVSLAASIAKSRRA